MRISNNTTVQGKYVMLVPYRAEHVPQYHEWMQDTHLQQATASEPLTMDEEYDMQVMAFSEVMPLLKCGTDKSRQRLNRDKPGAIESYAGSSKQSPKAQPNRVANMTCILGVSLRGTVVEIHPKAPSTPYTCRHAVQRSWAEDEDKLTFIVLDRSLPDTPGTGSHGGAMAGDVNLFFTLGEEEGGRQSAEIEVMIAELASRGKGLAKEALCLLMAYATRELGVKRYVAKIHEVNQPSRGLFEGLGFTEFRRVPVFGEVHYELQVDKSVDWLCALQDSLVYGSYD
ncbi:hypothetical protein VaNZ11_013553 [Volvox africanus]|uniref:N-acetyltransferase domain-containing protein n=1 Tax=Volvox africanus TaxID=51714 RepID=A0ABQ5SGW5_9CHLO|nr:hypothetical protein VaNZ11_013553 [Volvox africanus]